MKPTLPPPRPIAHLIAATLAGAVTLGLLASVAALFQRDGKPMERLVLAEHACIGHAYVSEREACVRQWLAQYGLSHGERVTVYRLEPSSVHD